MFGINWSNFFGVKKEVVKTVDSITSTYRAMVDELNTHKEQKTAEIAEHDSEIARLTTKKEEAKKEVDRAHNIAEKLKNVFDF